MPRYEREEAIKYAQKWCNDHNPDYPNFDAMGANNSDCANFVSQCMHEGGKMPMKFTGGKYTKWYYRSLDDRAGAWADCQSLRLFIKNNETEYPRMPYAFLSNSQVNMLEPGDVVFELEDGAANNKPGRKAKHVSLVSRVVGSKIYVYSHSEPKDDEEWRPSLSDTILCHFTGEILTEGSDGGSDDTSSWEARYGTALLKKSNTYSSYVENLQTDLISLNYNVGPDGADGYYGDNTVSAVTQFQRDNDLQADGLAGDLTKAKLYSLVYGD